MLARPEAVSPLSVAGRARLRRVCIRHPGYKSDPNNILLNLPVVDCGGLHHRTVLTAGAIIANNEFKRAFLTHDQAGTEPVTAGLDDILEPGDYWLHLRPGHEDPMGPPPCRGSSTSASSPHSQASTPYPIVPSFQDWRFPHGQLPPEWTSSHHPPPLLPQPAPETSNDTTAPIPHTHTVPLPPTAPPPCCVTALRTGVERCHLVPQGGLLKEWFTSNGMAQYASDPARGIGDTANMAIMRSDICSMFDAGRFAIVPKPSAGPPGPGSAPSPSYALAVHVLNEGFDELIPLYHNFAIQSSSAATFSPEFLLARFALSLFPLVRSFVDSLAPRYLAVSKLDASEDISTLVWMSGRDFAQHREQRGQRSSGSRKRASSHFSWDSQGDEHADGESDNWGRARKRHCRDNGDDFLDMYLSGGQAEGRAAAAEPSGLKGLDDGCEWWRSERAQAGSPDSSGWGQEEEQSTRGRPRYKAP